MPTDPDPRRDGRMAALAAAIGAAAGIAIGVVAGLLRATATARPPRPPTPDDPRPLPGPAGADAGGVRDELLSMLGHELRNPLNAIATSVEVLRKADPGSALAASARAVLGRQTRQLTSTVEQLVDAGRVLAGEIAMRRQPVAVADVVHRALQSRRAEATERGLRLEAADLAACHVVADADRLEQAVGHLLDHALRCTPGGGRIEVGVAARGGSAALTVRDGPAGVDPAPAALPFEPLAPGRPARGAHALGLALAYRLIELQGGSVHVSGAPAGSAVEIRLPLVER